MMKVDLAVGSLPIGSFVSSGSVYYRVFRHAKNAVFLEAGYDALGDKFFDAGFCRVPSEQIVTLIVRFRN